MSDFLKSLVARQLGDVPTVRPRLAGRFEPPPEAFAPEAPTRASAWGEHDSDALEHFLEVETRPAPSRDVETPHDNPVATRPHATQPESSDTPERVVFIRESRVASRPVLSTERTSSHASEQKHDALSPGLGSKTRDEHETPSTTAGAESRTQTRADEDEEGDASVRPRSIVPASVEEARPVKPFTQTHRPAPFTTRERADRRTPSTLEPREPSSREVDDAQRSVAEVRPSTASTLARREADGEQRTPEEKSSLTRVEPARAEARAKESEGEAETYAARHVRRARQEAASMEPQPARRRARQTATHDDARKSAEVAPTINVTIGRVEVRATQGQPAAKRRSEDATPRMSLDDYLRRRNGEVRE
jgi:hypothetical protein